MIRVLKLIIVVVMVVFSVSETVAQDKISVSGIVIDKETQELLPFVTIAIREAINDAVLTGTITNDFGEFSITDIPLGKYKLVVSSLGYETYSKPLIASGLNFVFDFGKIELAVAHETLGEVSIIGKRSIVNKALDKKSFDLSDNVALTGGSVMDAMKTMPGVSFDQDGKVILRGSDKVAVLIDGKQSSLSGFGNQKGLSNIPSANIERIEIINNPSAKYDANGFAGIVNIIYKKDKQTGINGNVGLSFGLGALSKKKEDLPTDLGSYSVNPKLIPSLNFNYRTDKFNYFFQSEFIVQEALPNNEFTTRYYDDGRVIDSQVAENRKQFRSIITGGMDWEVSEKDAFTFSVMLDREKHIDTSQVAYINVNEDSRERYYTWKEEEVTSFMNFALAYKHRLNEVGRTISANAQYTRGLEDESYFLNDSSAVRIGKDMTNIRAIEHTTSVSADYEHPLSNGRLEFGVKLRFRYLPVEYTVDYLPVEYTVDRGHESIIYPDLGDYSNWKEDLYASYGNYLLEKEKYDIEAGLRIEQTNVSYDLDPENIYYPENDDYDYLELFPSLRFTYKLALKHKISLFYNRRIDRPGEAELRVFPKYDDPELLKVGNPYLRPQLTDGVEAAYRFSWGSGSLFTSLYYRQIHNTFQRIYTIDYSNPEYDIVNRIYVNIGESTNAGVELLFNQDITDYWKLMSSANIYRNQIEAYEGTVLFPYERPFFIEYSSDIAGDLKLTNSFTLPWESEFQIIGLWYSGRNIPQGEQLPRSSIDLGFKKSLWNKKGAITFSASDVLNNFGLQQKIKGDGFDVVYENYYETQIFRIGLNYKF
ncbi:TonB-dependent receptor domain-containing protein [Formosa sp. PL04]|uniref:TonB-dependent receptor domain-containing protein n=1 Tax=Formosa sp. PL04 TaxID=3081755 RepID=UPI0029812BBA|nr:TonB-dependent receptor [Formosa sp. PL04]MDW5290334.1 TonB-dependent receptor [Formosa sp. PL04]